MRKFEDKVDNRREVVFVPKLKCKPHAIEPLDLTPIEDETDGSLSYPHPYEKELRDFHLFHLYFHETHIF